MIAEMGAEGKDVRRERTTHELTCYTHFTSKLFNERSH